MSTSLASRWNLDAIESAYARWRQDPSSVDESWRLFFEGFDLGLGRASQLASEAGFQGRIIRLIDAYRDLGHFLARLDPLSHPPSSIPLLEPAEFGLEASDLDRVFDTSHFLGMARGTLRDLLKALRETYCRTIGVEYMHIQNPRVRHWLQERMEPCRNQARIAREKKLGILSNLHAAELFEKFLHTSYVGQKRYSLEGAETLIPLLDALIERAADAGVKEIVLGMAHRGRLNVLANILGQPLAEIFGGFEDNFLPFSSGGDGDVKYHLGFSSDWTSAQGNRIHLSLSPNPSHLEAVYPVVEGRTRAKQDHFGDGDGVKGMAVVLHGDASFIAQGVVAETLNLSQLAGYRTGGTVHIVVNNQIGFTTAPADARSTVYCTDVAKMIEVPIFHVNFEDPESVVFVTQLAFDFRQTFHQDVVIDLVCYRRHGHNEGDDPSFTQPLMVAKIKDRPTVSKVYTEQLLQNRDLTPEESQTIDDEFQAKLQAAKEQAKQDGSPSSRRREPDGKRAYAGYWKGLSPHYSHAPVETGVERETLLRITKRLTEIPDNFHVHPKIARQLERRLQDMKDGKPLDWSLAEALAFGSLLLEGHCVRLTGEDSQRGTFSQRHAVLVDVQTDEKYYPLKALDPEQGPFFIYDSPLSETAVLGFEFGYSLDSPGALVLWEAQFGDFVNGGQVVIDQFLVCSQSKWQRDSGLVLLLPHGYEGQGPEHSSARLERFLEMCAEDNIQVCNPSTPAQYFHVLRRQVHRNFRKPLILMTPKSLLRHKKAVSPIEAFTAGHFQEVLDDEVSAPAKVRRVLLCSGKIYYDLLEKRDPQDAHLAIVRIEQFYPLAEDLLRQAVGRYPKVKEIIWVQEESQNMGGWTFIEPRLRALGFEVQYIGRDSSASPATGSRQVHLAEQKEIVETALVGKAPHLVRATPSAPLQRLKGRQDVQGDGEAEVNRDEKSETEARHGR